MALYSTKLAKEVFTIAESSISHRLYLLRVLSESRLDHLMSKQELMIILKSNSCPMVLIFTN